MSKNNKINSKSTDKEIDEKIDATDIDLTDAQANLELVLESNKKNEAGKGGEKWVLRILLLLLLVVVILLAFRQCGYIRFPWEKPQVIVSGDLFPGVKDAEDGHLSNMTQEEILAQMQKQADASKFSFKINARPSFENGNTKGYLGIENPSYNVYPIVVQIFLDETGELIYDSGGMLPNQHIDNAKLIQPLKKGVYEATAYMNAYDPDTMLYLGRSASAIIITIHN